MDKKLSERLEEQFGPNQPWELELIELAKALESELKEAKNDINWIANCKITPCMDKIKLKQELQKLKEDRKIIRNIAMPYGHKDYKYSCNQILNFLDGKGKDNKPTHR